MGFFTGVTIQDRADFANSLSVMLKSGMPINEALLSLSEQTTSRSLKSAIVRVYTDVGQGSLLSQAFARETKRFDPILVSLVRAGEASGTLQENLAFLADWFTRSADLKREVDGATLYPKLVLGAAIFLGGGLAVFILPRLVPLFGQLDVELPLITTLLLLLSVFLQEMWLWCVLSLVAIAVMLKILLKNSIVQRFVHSAAISVPFIGPILKQYQLALLSQLFATLLRSGVPISEALVIVQDAVPNIVYRESLSALRVHITSGTTLTHAMHEFPSLYPKLYVGILAVGEQSGTLSDSFTYLAEHYSKEVKAMAKRLPTVIEPLLLICIAGIVGLVALAIILPIYKLTGSINI